MEWIHKILMNTKNILMTQIHESMISYLDPDILVCEVNWALGSITMNKASGDKKKIQPSHFKS